MLRLIIVFFLIVSVCFSSEYRPTIDEAEKNCREATFAKDERININNAENDNKSHTRDMPQYAEESWVAMRIKRAEAVFNSIKAERVAYRECMSKYGYKR